MYIFKVKHYIKGIFYRGQIYLHNPFYISINRYGYYTKYKDIKINVYQIYAIKLINFGILNASYKFISVGY